MQGSANSMAMRERINPFRKYIMFRFEDCLWRQLIIDFANIVFLGSAAKNEGYIK
jgi:hypothetical protein